MSIAIRNPTTGHEVTIDSITDYEPWRQAGYLSVAELDFDFGGGGGLSNPLTGDLNFGGHHGTNAHVPNAPDHVATKGYVDSHAVAASGVTTAAFQPAPGSVEAALQALLVAAGWQWDPINKAWASVGVGGADGGVGPIVLTALDDLPVDAGGPFLSGTAGLTQTAGHPLNLAAGMSPTPDHAPGEPNGAADLKLRGGRGRGSAAGGDIVLLTTRPGASNHITGEVVKAGDTLANVAITGTIAHVPIFLNTQITVTDSSIVPQQVFFQSDGTMVGAIGSGGTNTWDPLTGVFSFSFAADSTGPVTADYMDNLTNALVETMRIRALDGFLKLSNTPTADPHVVGAVWSNAGVLTLSAG